jgi:hypothetical protein
MQRVLIPAVTTGLLALALTGCGVSHQLAAVLKRTDGASGGSTTGAASSQLSRTAPVSVRHAALPPVGSTQHVVTDGARLEVTLRSVIDPLRDSGAELEHGTRAVGVVFQIRSAGPRIYDSSATGDISIVVSGGAVTPVLATRGVCRTPVQDFDRYITTGEDRVGCVVFAIDDAAAVDAVRFAPHAQMRRALTWAG